MTTAGIMKVAHLMTSDPITVRPSDVVTKVKEIFETNAIHHIPVVDDHRVVGMVSKSDFLSVSNAFPLFNKEKREAYNDRLFSTIIVEEIMTKQVAKVQPDDTLDFAAGIFRENLFHALPVVNERGKLVGILTTYDIMNYFFTDRPLLV